MWVRTWFAIALLTVAAEPVYAQQCDDLFTQSLVVMKDGAIEVYYQICKSVVMTETRTVTVMETRVERITDTVNGEPVVRTVEKAVPVTKEMPVTVCKYVCEMQQRKLDAAQVEACDATGKAIAWNALAKQLAKPTLVVMTINGKPLPPNMAAVFKPTTIFISTKPVEFAPPLPPVPFSAPPAPPTLVEPHEGPINQAAPAILPVAPPAQRPLPAPAELRPRAVRTEGLFKPVAFQVAAADADAELPRMPTTVPPSLKLASLSDEGVSVKTVSTFDSTVNISPTQVDDEGKPIGERETIPIVQRTQTSMSTIFPLEYVTAVTIDGRKLSPEILVRFLQTERAVIVTNGANKIDKFWLQNMKPTTVILTVPEVLPPPSIPAPALPAPDAPQPPAEPPRGA